MLCCMTIYAARVTEYGVPGVRWLTGFMGLTDDIGKAATAACESSRANLAMIGIELEEHFPYLSAEIVPVTG
jgi:hypothetical protein